jgi:hypothetical protein
MLSMSLAMVASADEKAPATTGSYAGEVTASRLQLRAGPGEAYQSVATLKKGDMVVVVGKHPNQTDWLVVEVPQGYEAWVFGGFLAVGKDKQATVTTERLLVRPRATTRFHQLNGRLNKGESVRVVDQKETAEGLWYKVVVPRRFPLYAQVTFLRNAGPASLAEPKKTTKDIAKAATLASMDWDKRYLSIEKSVYGELPKVRAYDDAKQLRLQIMQVKPTTLSAANRERRIVLLSKIVTRERELAGREIAEREKSIGNELDKKLKEIEQRYREKLWRLRQEQKEAARKKPGYVAIGKVEYVPHLLGRHPSHRLTIDGKLRFYLVARDYDLDRFIGKRVGVVGLTDRESGTGLQTVLIKRIEVLTDDAK